jgi:hypothetical protein
MSDEDRLDGLFMNLAQQSQGIEPLLDNLFGFLRRKTDFYNGASLEKIDSIVNIAIRKHYELYEHEKKIKEEKKKLDEIKLRKKKEAEAEKARVVKEENVMEIADDGSFDLSTAPDVSSIPVADENVMVPPSVEESTTDMTPEEQAIKLKEDEEDKTPPPIGNGGVTSRYVWTQTLSELTVNLKLPEGIKSKMLDVDIRNKHLKVSPIKLLLLVLLVFIISL